MRGETRVWRWLTNGRFLLASALVFASAIATVRLLPGIPQGVDSTSHLHRVIFMFHSLTELGYIPVWSPDWYGGTAFTLFYPPLSYWIVLLLAVAGFAPITAYKIVDAAAYVLSPLSVYVLCRELDLDSRSSAAAALLFSFSPTIIENYVFYDRFPNILSIPLTCAFILTTIRAAKGTKPYLYTVLSGTIFGAIVLIHHLSALLVAGIAALIVATTFLRSRNLGQRIFIVVVAAFACGLAIATFWVVPFLNASNHLVTNTFYNRNIEFPFVRISYFLLNVATYSFGISQFALAMYYLGKLSFADSRRPLNRSLACFAALFGGMGLFEVGEKLLLPFVKWSGQALIAAFFLVLLAMLVLKIRANNSVTLGTMLLLSWFVVFLWLSLGNRAAPFVDLAILSWIWRRLDVHRFWLFLTIPMSALGALALTSLSRGTPKSEWRRRVVVASMVTIVLLGGVIKYHYSTTQKISEFLPYPPTNSDIPPSLVEYLKEDRTYARVLAIKCPLWIYVLPHYTGKPLIDGWYPQEKLLDELMRINDYRILDLETAGSEENRTETWRRLILDSDLLAIKWVVIGVLNTPAENLFNGTKFSLDATFACEEGSISVYRTSQLIRFIAVDPPEAASWSFERSAPDRMVVRFQELRQRVTITVKEAYYDTWRATAHGHTVTLNKDETGYITFQVEPPIETVELYHASGNQLPAVVSSVALVGLPLLGMATWVVIARRKGR